MKVPNTSVKLLHVHVHSGYIKFDIAHCSDIFRSNANDTYCTGF